MMATRFRGRVPETACYPALAAAASIRRIALLGSHAPRRCGIATFTTDRADAIAGDPAALDSFVLAMNGPGERHADDTAMLQHASFNIPRYDHGYCLDDNARGTVADCPARGRRRRRGPDHERPGLAYLAFVRHAFDRASGRFKNFMSYERQWTEACGSEDSHGRAVWALATVIGRSNDPGAKAPGATVRRAHRPEWPWLEETVTYRYARLPQALIVSGGWMGDREMTATGCERSSGWRRFSTGPMATSAP